MNLELHSLMDVKLSDVKSKTGKKRKKCIFVQGWVEILMITLVSSPKQYLHIHMQHSAICHCYQRIDLPVKKGSLLIYGYNADLLYIFRQYIPMLLR